jgi:hypothetical protein
MYEQIRGGRMKSKRSKSGLLPPAEAAKAREPETGPGSATCFCRRMERRAKAEEARQALRGRTASQNAGSDGAKFADFSIGDIEALDEFYEALKNTLKSGAQYRILVAVL